MTGMEDDWFKEVICPSLGLGFHQTGGLETKGVFCINLFQCFCQCIGKECWVSYVSGNDVHGLSNVWGRVFIVKIPCKGC